MKLLHTADWHLGKRLQDFQRLQEQRDVLAEITEVANREDVDLVLVAGDLFDTFNPDPKAEDLLYSTLKDLTANGRRTVVAIAGNHDNPDRIEAQDHFGRECGIIFAGFPKTEVRSYELSCEAKLLCSAPGFIELKLPRHEYPIRIILTPYANETRLRSYLGMAILDDELRQHLHQHWAALADTYMDDQGVNLLMAHLFVMKRGGEQPEESDDERSILQVGGASVVYTDMIPPQIQYTALGHLHRYQQLAGGPSPVVYSSSPLAYSFAEADQQKYIVIIEAEPGKAVTVNPIPLATGKRLLRPKFKRVDEAVEWLTENPNCYAEITMQTTTFLTSDERRQLQQAHESLVTIIPDVQDVDDTVQEETTAIDLTQPMEALFTSYFKNKNKGQEPNERLQHLFKEILATDPE
ncbi:metallophosphoesterase family protein [Spirosoma pollinicola]|uniref:Nuclease SbcCD subunit D n=1 Tax=Spirosoma pollinicola TaxID=2057025 RepID=A0A2K8Z055_9BACT|nr:exonuclease SbcCD subunit D [Spirosoma pollinicola]AUD03262.1 exonuclease sbcCD subunit D [Spirosoma pollinicola]